MDTKTETYISGSPFEKFVKVLAKAVVVADLQLELGLLILMMKMILDPLLHPYALFVKFGKKQLH